MIDEQQQRQNGKNTDKVGRYVSRLCCSVLLAVGAFKARSWGMVPYSTTACCMLNDTIGY